MPTNLFPISHGRISCGWTTSTTIPPPNPLILCVPLQDVALGAHKDWKRTPRPIVTPPSGNGASERHQLPPESAWEVVYPAGSINPGGGIKGGTSFYISGPRSFKEELETACEVMFSYRVMFMDGWDARLGGKLPGAFGGEGDSAYSCTGGQQHDRGNCFNLRLMWREDGMGEIYAYVPFNEENKTQLSQVPPYSKQNPDYGFSVGRGAFRFEPGRWHTVAERVRLNVPEQADGEIELWFDGESVIRVGGLRLRENPRIAVRGLHMQTFYGGHTAEWAPSQDQRAWFGDLSAAILRENT